MIMRADEKAFYSLQLIGGVGFIAIALTAALSRNIKRHPFWFSFCISWAISSVSYSLLLVTGQATRTFPNFYICATQAALVYAVPALTAASTFAMFIYVYFTLKSIFSQADLSHITRFRMMMIIVPYVLWTVIFVTLLVFAALRGDYVGMSNNGYYCNLTTPIPKKVSSVIVFIFTLAIVIFEVIISLDLYRRWGAVSKVPQALGMAIRVLAFGMVVILALILSIVYLFPINLGPSIDITLAIMPVLGVIMFGAQKDILNAWKFWGRLETDSFEK